MKCQWKRIGFKHLSFMLIKFRDFLLEKVKNPILNCPRSLYTFHFQFQYFFVILYEKNWEHVTVLRSLMMNRVSNKGLILSYLINLRLIGFIRFIEWVHDLLLDNQWIRIVRNITEFYLYHLTRKNFLNLF